MIAVVRPAIVIINVLPHQDRRTRGERIERRAVKLIGLHKLLIGEL